MNIRDIKGELFNPFWGQRAVFCVRLKSIVCQFKNAEWIAFTSKVRRCKSLSSQHLYLKPTNVPKVFKRFQESIFSHNVHSVRNMNSRSRLFCTCPANRNQHDYCSSSILQLLLNQMSFLSLQL